MVVSGVVDHGFDIRSNQRLSNFVFADSLLNMQQ